MRETEMKEIEALEKELTEPLSRYMVSSPKPEDTRCLIANLQEEFNEIKEEHSFPTIHRTRPSFYKLCKNQLHAYHKSFWAVSVFVFVLITLSTSGMVSNEPIMPRNLFSTAIPLFLLIGMAYIYRSWNKEMRTIENINPFPPALLMLSRLLIVVAINIVLGLLGTLYLQWTVQSFAFLTFMLSWLSVVLFVGGLMAYLTYRKGIMTGFVVSLAAFVLFHLFQEWLITKELLALNQLKSYYGLFLMAGIACFLLTYRLDSFKAWSSQGSKTA
ncbi:hypothetical protein [Paenibacillus sp. J2TS4]|uniref:hypothetical protein n=1 Tax=Paenibacillus sp. J2TS4 TaxID=2807194 RepID=UPI001B2B3EAB|nr:hypothetical protein [Paenibacillus sp. J2TS4]GIP35492.1 hypothetical protein J2TS4_47020 [Paenibacillus sp. J2TS4]